MTELLQPTSPTEITSATLRELAEVADDDVVVTVAVHTLRATSEPQQNALRLKSATQRVEQQLSDRGLDPPRLASYTDPLEQLQADEQFCSHQLDALYATVWSGGWRAFRLPYEVSERTVIDARPHLQPLLPAVAEQGTFYVLALSQAHVRLLRASRAEVSEVDLSHVDMPQSIDDVVPDDQEQRPDLQHHPGQRGSRIAIFHGHSDSGEFERQLVDKYLHRVARGIDDLLAADHRPVVLAGVDTVCAQYRGHTRLGTVMDGNVSGNPDEAHDAALRDEALPIVRPVLRRPLDEAIEQFRAHHGTGMALGDLPEILPAAAMGRVGTLLVREGAERWGRFDPTEGLLADRSERVELHDEDLIERAIALTLTRGGEAYLLPAREMPVDGEAAAVCRY